MPKRLTIYVPDDRLNIVEDLKRIAKDERRPLSALVLLVCEEYISTRKEAE